MEVEMNRCYSLFDKLCLGIDQALRTLTHHAPTTGSPYPAEGMEEPPLNEDQRKRSAGLMRVNHAGEVCAQALYHGQGLVSRESAMQENMRRAAVEEGDHLDWCKHRLDELGSHTSYLNPLWYIGSFCIGAAAGMAGDAWSLGFVVETERQVIRHLEGHLQLLPAQDARSHTILEHMEWDETKHRDDAITAGARELPAVIKRVMAMTSKVMVKMAYFV